MVASGSAPAAAPLPPLNHFLPSSPLHPRSTHQEFVGRLGESVSFTSGVAVQAELSEAPAAAAVPQVGPLVHRMRFPALLRAVRLQPV